MNGHGFTEAKCFGYGVAAWLAPVSTPLKVTSMSRRRSRRTAEVPLLPQRATFQVRAQNNLRG